MDEEDDKKLLYAIHYKEQYDLDQQIFNEYSVFLVVRQTLSDSTGEVQGSELLVAEEAQMLKSFQQRREELKGRQTEQWHYYHNIEMPDRRVPDYRSDFDVVFLRERAMSPEIGAIGKSKAGEDLGDKSSTVAKEHLGTRESLSAKEQYRLTKREARKNQVLEQLYQLRDSMHNGADRSKESERS